MEERQVDMDAPAVMPESYFLTQEDKKALLGENTIVFSGFVDTDFGLHGIIDFKGKRKYFPLKTNNYKAMISKYGSNKKAWVGVPIKIFGTAFHKAGLNDGVEVKIV